MTGTVLLGVPLTPERRRRGFMAFLGLAAVAFLVALIPTLLAWESAGAFLITAVVLLAISLAGELALLLVGETDDLEDAESWVQEEEAVEAEETPPAQELLLRCKSCKEVFPVLDSGERPLRAECTHCGTVGVIKNVPVRR